MSLPLDLHGRFSPAGGPGGPGGAAQAQAAAQRPLRLSQALVIANGSAQQTWSVPMSGSWVIERAGIMSDNPPNSATLLTVYRGTALEVGALVDYTRCPDLDVSEYDPPLILSAGEILTALLTGPDGGSFTVSFYGWQA